MIRTLGNGHAELEVRMVSIYAAIEHLRAETAAAMRHSVASTKQIAGAMDAEIAKLLAEVQELIGAPPEPEPAREAMLGEPAVQFREAAE